jgi:hypothetical protein
MNFYYIVNSKMNETFYYHSNYYKYNDIDIVSQRLIYLTPFVNVIFNEFILNYNMKHTLLIYSYCHIINNLINN